MHLSELGNYCVFLLIYSGVLTLLIAAVSFNNCIRLYFMYSNS